MQRPFVTLRATADPCSAYSLPWPQRLFLGAVNLASLSMGHCKALLYSRSWSWHLCFLNYINFLQPFYVSLDGSSAFEFIDTSSHPYLVSSAESISKQCYSLQVIDKDVKTPLDLSQLFGIIHMKE